MIAHTIDHDEAYCWRCGVWLLGSRQGDSNVNGSGDGYGDGNSRGNGYGDGYGYGYGSYYGNGWGNGHGNGGNGYGNGNGGPLPFCDDPLACACRQAQSPV